MRTRKHLTTGFLGTPSLCHVLSRYGYLDEAYLLLNREEYPSWLYPVKQGATTIWERWDGQKPDGSFQTVEMNSFNHYAYGAIGDWMYRVWPASGSTAPGYKHVLIQPNPGDLEHAEASFKSVRGLIRSAWRRTPQGFELAVEVPNVTATVVLPVAGELTESGEDAATTTGVRQLRRRGEGWDRRSGIRPLRVRRHDRRRVIGGGSHHSGGRSTVRPRRAGRSRSNRGGAGK